MLTCVPPERNFLKGHTLFDRVILQKRKLADFHEVGRNQEDLGELLSDGVIFRPEEEQRVSFAHNHIFHLGDEDGVIPSVASILKTAFEVG
jgi:hypothetical protein